MNNTCSALYPLRFQAETVAPFWTRVSATESSPAIDARWSAVLPANINDNITDSVNQSSLKARTSNLVSHYLCLVGLYPNTKHDKASSDKRHHVAIINSMHAVYHSKIDWPPCFPDLCKISLEHSPSRRHVTADLPTRLKTNKYLPAVLRSSFITLWLILLCHTPL